MKNKQKINKNKAFTLLELLVVISIIALLSSIILAAANKARVAGRTAKRISDLKQVQVALEMYYGDNGAYPLSAGTYRSECYGFGSYAPNAVIPGLSPTYILNFPSDPGMNKSAATSCYMYIGTATAYKFFDHDVRDYSAADYMKNYPAFGDPNRDGGTNPYTLDGSTPWSWAIYTPGAESW